MRMLLCLINNIIARGMWVRRCRRRWGWGGWWWWWWWWWWWCGMTYGYNVAPETVAIALNLADWRRLPAVDPLLTIVLDLRRWLVLVVLVGPLLLLSGAGLSLGYLRDRRRWRCYRYLLALDWLALTSLLMNRFGLCGSKFTKIKQKTNIIQRKLFYWYNFIWGKVDYKIWNQNKNCHRKIVKIWRSDTSDWSFCKMMWKIARVMGRRREDWYFAAASRYCSRDSLSLLHHRSKVNLSESLTWIQNKRLRTSPEHAYIIELLPHDWVNVSGNTERQHRECALCRDYPRSYSVWRMITT